MRAATRAIGLKAAKGDVKAYTAVTAKRAAIENRRRAEREEILTVVMEYKEQATLELMRRKRGEYPDPRSFLILMTSISIQRRAPSFLTVPVRLTKRWLRIFSCRLGPRLNESGETHALPSKGSLVLTSIREVPKTIRNHRLPGGETGIQDQFMGPGDAGGANRLSKKVPLADGKQGLSSGVRPIRMLFQIDFPPLARDRTDRGGTAGVCSAST